MSRKTILVREIELSPEEPGETPAVLVFRGFTVRDKAELSSLAGGIADAFITLWPQLDNDELAALATPEEARAAEVNKFTELLRDGKVSVEKMFTQLFGDTKTFNRALEIFESRCVNVKNWLIDAESGKPEDRRPITVEEAFQFMEPADVLTLLVAFLPSPKQVSLFEGNSQSPLQSLPVSTDAKSSIASDVDSTPNSKDIGTVTAD